MCTMNCVAAEKLSELLLTHMPPMVVLASHYAVMLKYRGCSLFNGVWTRAITVPLS